MRRIRFAIHSVVVLGLAMGAGSTAAVGPPQEPLHIRLATELHIAADGSATTVEYAWHPERERFVPIEESRFAMR